MDNLWMFLGDDGLMIEIKKSRAVTGSGQYINYCVHRNGLELDSEMNEAKLFHC